MSRRPPPAGVQLAGFGIDTLQEDEVRAPGCAVGGQLTPRGRRQLNRNGAEGNSQTSSSNVVPAGGEDAMVRKVGSAVVASFLVGGLAFCSPGRAETALRTVALSGEAAPGTGAGVVFLAFESPYNRSFPVPLVDDSGQMIFFAFLAGPGVGPENDQGLWTERQGSLALLARSGERAPGTGDGVLFHGLPSAVIPLGFRPAGARAAFPATLTGPGVGSGNDDGLWSDASGSVELVLREDDAAPGLGADVRFGMPGLHRFTSGHQSLIFAKLRGGSVTALDDETVWSHQGSTLTLRAREGDPAPGTEPGVVFGDGELGSVPGAFPFADFNASGRLLLRADLEGPGVDEHSDEALFSDRTGALELILREGDPAPGAGQGVTFGGNSVALHLHYPTINALDQIAFSTRLGGSIPTTSALFSDHLGSLTLLALPGDPAPGSGGSFTLLGSPVLSDGGRVAFAASIESGAYPPSGIYWDQPGSLEALILPGDPIPDRPGTTLVGAGAIFGFASSGFLAFRAGIDGPAGPGSALLVAAPSGAISTVVAAGDLVDVDGQGDVRTVSLIFPGGLAENGALPVRLSFADGSSGIFVTSVRVELFADGFESGDTSRWSVSVP